MDDPNRAMVEIFRLTECADLPVITWDTQAVWLRDKIYIGGGRTSRTSSEDAAKLYSYSPSKHKWGAVSNHPVYLFALTTYQFHLVLVGGVESSDGSITNKLWTLHENDEWKNVLPPMTIERACASAVSHEEHLLVAGGTCDVYSPDPLDSVEVYDGNTGQWATAQPLPQPSWFMKSAVLNESWYLLGGYEQDEEVYFASLDLLIASYEASEALEASSVWSKLPDVPSMYSSIAVIGNRLISMGGFPPNSDIHTYSPYTRSWMHIGEMSVALRSSCSIVVPTGELVVIGGLPTSDSKLQKFTVEKGEYADILMHLKDKTINHLCKEVSTLRERYNTLKTSSIVKTDTTIKMLIAENKWLRKQTAITWDLRGVEVSGEKTIIVDAYAQQIIWKGFGLRLHISDGTLPAGIQQCVVSIKASLSGHYEFPENFHLVSAIFWFRCEPRCQFRKHIEAEIEHCVRSENVSKLTFVKAVCSQKRLPYTFRQVEGDFTGCSSYGVIKLSSFSALAIAQEGSAERQYYSKLFYLSNYLGGHRIDLIITWHTEAHLNVVKHHYKEEGAQPGPDQPIDFEGNEIRLDLPMEVTAVKDKWTIIPLTDPVVTKNEVDSYLPGKRIPHCSLEAHPISGSVTRLIYKIDLLGAKPPHNKFILSYIPPIVPAVGHSTTHSMTSTESAIPRLKDLLKELSSRVANEWENIGIQLDIEDGQLKQVKSDTGGDSRACLREMFRIWLSCVNPPPSWSAIAEALECLGSRDIASQLKSKYC